MEFNDVTSTFYFHRAQPNVSLEDYVRQERIQLGREVSKKYRIYLDLRFWILLRDVELGKNKKQGLIELLNRLNYLVNNEKAICPISESVFIEVMKQSDQVTRVATSQLIDCLSNGVSLIIHPQRISQELCNAVYLQAGADYIYPLDILVWIKLAYVLGEIHPYQTPFGADEELVIQKCFFDHMLNVSLVEMVDCLDFKSWHQPNWQNIADFLNDGNKKYANKMKSFRQVYRTEFEGGLSLFRDKLMVLIKEVENAGYKDFEKNSESLTRSERFSKFSKSVRTLHIGACCYAAVRWDQKRQLTGNDLIDFHHAEAAIGYCNLFLTEKPLKALVSQQHLGLLSDYPCTVASTTTEAFKALSGI